MDLEYRYAHYLKDVFLQVQGIEILENAQIGNESLRDKYPVIRGNCLHLGTDIISVLGLSGSGKGGIAMGLYRLLRADPVLKEWFKGEKKVDVVPVPFTLFPEVAKLKGLIPKNIPHGAYSTEQYHASTQLMHELMIEYEQGNPESKIIYIVEASSPTAYPVIERVEDIPWDTDTRGLIPVRSGNPDGVVRDRGLSVVYSYAIDLKRRQRTQTLAVKRQGRVKRLAQGVRDPANGGDIVGSLRQAGVKMLLEDKKGDEIDTTRFTEKQMAQFNQFLRLTFAPLSGIKRSDEEFVRMRKAIPFTSVTGERSSIPNQHSFYSWLQEELRIPRHQFGIVTNEFLEGDKTFDAGYFLNSLPVRRRMFPELIPEFLRNRL